MKKYIRYFLCTILFVTPAYADEYEDKVRELLTISNTLQPAIDMADSMLENMATQTINQIHQSFKDQGKDVARDEVVKLYNDYRTEMVAALGENMVTILIEPYKENFTIDELDELISLMKSPTFQKFSTKMPELMAASQSAGEEFGLRKGQEIMIRLIAENPNFH